MNKELANIRSKFKGDKTLDGYQKKKYVCKLLFIFLLGHDIDFGHMEAVNLLSSNKYSEKQIVSNTNWREMSAERIVMRLIKFHEFNGYSRTSLVTFLSNSPFLPSRPTETNFPSLSIPGLSLHLRTRQHQQRSDQAHHPEHQE